MNKDERFHLFLKQKIDAKKTKHYYFRHTKSEYECEEFENNEGTIIGVKYYNTDKAFLDSVLENEKTIGSSFVIYFRSKKDNSAFGEEIIKKN